jgi:tetratricopeptide (TPR) repeat protein
MNNEIEIITQLDNDAIAVESDDSASALEKWKIARRLAENRLTKAFTPEWSYIAGYLCYMLFARGACPPAVTERHLTGGLISGSKQGLAQFYLASLYFDLGRSEEAIQHLEYIYKYKREYFNELGQEWRYVKSIEMLVSVYIHNKKWANAYTIGMYLDVIYHKLEEPESMMPLALLGSLEETDCQGITCEKLCAIAVRIVHLTRSESATKRLFPRFSTRWIQPPTSQP